MVSARAYSTASLTVRQQHIVLARPRDVGLRVAGGCALGADRFVLLGYDGGLRGAGDFRRH